ncbi:MAG: hypothetical protein SV253_09170 [Halobacteria archaeon]|nr:hypothetical protein [Halobacteria archaeon]
MSTMNQSSKNVLVVLLQGVVIFFSLGILLDLLNLMSSNSVALSAVIVAAYYVYEGRQRDSSLLLGTGAVLVVVNAVSVAVF